MGFWLDDAFASGGSAGYDHKKMGITARGAWEAVKRHFREMDKRHPDRALHRRRRRRHVGRRLRQRHAAVRQTRLIAAFDHRDIFIDPDPDTAASFAERKRLFALPRSSWQDYDSDDAVEGRRHLLASQKTITPVATGRRRNRLGKTRATPHEIMTAILKAPVDLLWFGGIGTYVRAATKSNVDAGDRANDAIRITGREVGAKVIGEGANLGITQSARIEFAAHGRPDATPTPSTIPPASIPPTSRSTSRSR